MSLCRQRQSGSRSNRESLR